MSDNNEFDVDSDTEIDPINHAKLIKNVLNLNKRPKIEKPSRTEPSLEVSEFGLVQSTVGKRGSVNLQKLAKVLKKRDKYVAVNNKVKYTETITKTLEKPLEKPQAERIRRSVAFDTVKQDLEKWRPIVASNRAQTHLSFPSLTDEFLQPPTKAAQWRIKGELQKKMEALEPPAAEVHTIAFDEEQKQFPLTVQELMERRNDAAKMRAVQSYKEAKARRLRKIKSKKFHRIERRQRTKQQIKEFELLQKTNPEEALEKLNEIERARAEERMSLRHKGTGKWAKNQQIRAKYDKETRQALTQQLTISKELTQKLRAKVDSDDEEDEENVTELPHQSPTDGDQHEDEPESMDVFKEKYEQFEKIKKKSKSVKKPTKNRVSNSKALDLEMPTTAKRPIIDEELDETAENEPAAANKDLYTLNKILQSEVKVAKIAPSANIDPTNIVKMIPTQLNTELPDLVTEDDNNEENMNMISEAFADDDIVDDFKKDKKQEIDQDKPGDVDLFLPGWGAWTGTGIKPTKRKQRRFIVKFPKKLPRRDDNKGNLVVNEKVGKIRSHLVSELPFPFTRVKDYEASIRAPIGNTFVPETAFRKMVQPAVYTRLGTVIKPMDESVLLKTKKASIVEKKKKNRKK